MEIKDSFYLGKVTKPFGLKGELVLYLDVDNPSEYTELDGVYININNRLVLYPIESIRINSNKAVVSFEKVEQEDSYRLVGKELYLPLELLPELKGNKFYFHEVIGFNVIDEEKGNIGHIEKILEYPTTPLFSIRLEDREILIPIVEPILQRVDREEETIYIKAPEGLIELYLD